MMIRITEKDVGREVILRSGYVATIVKYVRNDCVPFRLSNSTSVCRDGRFSLIGNNHPADVIAFADDTPTASDTREKIVTFLQAEVDNAIEQSDGERAIAAYRRLEQFLEEFPAK